MTERSGTDSQILARLAKGMTVTAIMHDLGCGALRVQRLMKGDKPRPRGAPPLPMTGSRVMSTFCNTGSKTRRANVPVHETWLTTVVDYETLPGCIILRPGEIASVGEDVPAPVVEGCPACSRDEVVKARRNLGPHHEPSCPRWRAPPRRRVSP